MSAEDFPSDEAPADALNALLEINPDPNQLEALEAELRTVMASWEYAFAMGHGCSVGDHPVHQATRQRVEYLHAQITELKDN